MDVVAGSWVNDWRDQRRHAVVWYENDGKQKFTAHGVATRPAGIASLKLLDVTGDGRLDIVAGAILAFGERPIADVEQGAIVPQSEFGTYPHVFYVEIKAYF